MDFNQIKANGNWGQESEKVNQNFQKAALELEKIKGASGAIRWFATVDEAVAAITNPRAGDFVWIGNPYPGTVHKYDKATGTWVNTGQIPIVADGDMSGYVTREEFEDLEEEVKDKATGEELSSLARRVDDKVDYSVLEDTIETVLEVIPVKTSELENDSGFITRDELGDVGSGTGNMYNVTKLHPLQAGNYYTLQTAIAAVTEDKRILGLVITFAVSDSKWETYQYTGTNTETAAWLTLDLWTEFGAGTGGGTVKGVSVNNGAVIEPDPEGIIQLPIDEIEVDETLNPASTNPVENKTLYGRFMELEAGGVFDSDVIIDDETGEATVYLYNKYGTVITQFTVPASGGTGGEVAGARIILSASVDKSVIKEGDPVILSYYYDQQYSAGDDAGTSTGQKATIAITIQRGSTVVYSGTVQDVSTGTYTMDISKYLSLGTIDVYVKAAATDPTTGKLLTRQGYTSIRVLSIGLSSSYNLASHITGYLAAETATIPFTVSGTGTKIVTMYVDGNQYESRTVTRSGATNGSFSLPMASLMSGRHTVQMVAELEDSSGLIIKSESIYIDLLRRGTSEVIRFIGAMIVFPDGRIFPPSQHLTPVLDVGQYEAMSFDFVVYDSTSNPATMDIYRDGVKSQTISAARTLQTYSNRFTEEGSVAMKFVSGTTEYPFFIQVSASDIDIEEALAGLVLRLMAAGRSNSEENPGEWSYGDITTKFSNFDWNSNGWTGDTLRLTNGAAIEIAYQPFATDPTGSGGSYEMELECTNVSDREAVIIDCMANGVGFQMTTQEATIRTVGGVEVKTLFASGITIKVAFVVRNKDNHRLLELFVNGIRCGVVQYAADDSMIQGLPASIKINSEYSDVDLRGIRVYNRALSDDEVLDNFIIDRPEGEDMVILFNSNNVETDDGTSIDIDKLRAMGKSVMRVVGDVNLVNQTNDKKFEVPVDVYFYSAYGKEYDFIARNIGLRIQGTSSTTYPRKNYRLYFNRSDKYGATLEVNGVNVPDFKYAMKPGARPIDIFCMKADFAESSSTHNTGAAKLMNDVWRKCGFLTPPQAAYNGQYDVRVAIDGDPYDMWYDNNGTNVNVYLGKYNFNNEKSASGIVYGFEGIEGFNDAATLAGRHNPCICLEFLNNSEPLCLFQIGGTDFDTYANSKFDDALEFRFKEDIVWSTAHADDKAAIKRLWTWVIACKNNPTKFVNEAADYFDLNNLSVWYLFTEYFMAVDQRAKNMMLATWDGLTWYFLPYDCDTILGVRNDGVLKYNYDIDHESWDDSIQSWCYAGHDSTLWALVREAMTSNLASVAGTFRSNMPTSDVLAMFNEEQMGNWSERVYNKDGEYKYITPLIEGVKQTDGTFMYYNYLYSLQGSRYAHRTFIIQNRFALLDAKYVAGTYRSDAFTAYFSHKFSTDPRKLRIIASEKYYFGYGYTSGQPTVSAVPAETAGDLVELTFSGDLIVNDPQNIYGASRIAELDLTNISEALVQTLNLNNCTSLKKLNASCLVGNTALNNILVANCKGLREINISGLRSAGFTSIDISGNSRLEKFNAANTSLTGVSFALGAPLSEVLLPASLTSLEMRSLNKLTLAGLTFASAGNITRLVAANCELLDWQELLTICYGVRYLRVTGINLTGDTTMLERFMSVGGIDENGSNTTSCRLVGDYQLTTYVEDDKLTEYRNHYPELNIRQAEYTAIEFDDSVADPANISNLDNKTGYKFGKDYVVSGHIKKILSLRHRVLGKKTALGKVTVCQLHDEDSNKYADSQYVDSASPAVLTGAEGNVWVYEPHYWYKGVNDILNQKKYIYMSTNTDVPTPEGKRIEARDMNFVSGQAIRATEEYSTLAAALVAVTSMSYAIVDVTGYRKVRFQGVAGAVYGAVFLDAAGTIIKRVTASSSSGMVDGMYVISDIPVEATQLAFSIIIADDRDFVWLSNSDKIEDMEPDWVEHKESLGSAYCCVAEDSILRSRSGVNPTNLTNRATIDEYVANMGSGFSRLTYDFKKNIAVLMMLKYGTRYSPFGTTGGQSPNLINGVNNSIGFRDTDNLVFDGVTKSTDSSLGYESLQSMYSVYMKNIVTNTVAGEFTVVRDGVSKKIKFPPFPSTGGTTIKWISKIYHGKHIDVLPSVGEGSSTTFFSDSYYTVSTPMTNAEVATGRLVATYGYIYGGRGMFSLSDSSYNAIVAAVNATRIIFEGTIEFANSVTEYKSLNKLD